jgi:hypothetical protein
MAIDATTGATKKLQELVEKVRGSDSKLTVSGVKKFDDANKIKLGLFQQGLASIKDQDPSVEARRKANFSIGNLATNFLINKAFGGEDALNNRKEFKNQRQAYQELKTEYLSSKFKDPETAALLYELAPKFEKGTDIRTAQSDFDKAMFIGTIGTTENGEPVPLEKQIETLRLKLQDGEISTSDQAAINNEIERRSMLFETEKANAVVDDTQSKEELLTSNYDDFVQSLGKEEVPLNETFDLETGYTKGQAGVGERTRGYRKGLLEELSKKKGDFGD